MSICESLHIHPHEVELLPESEFRLWANHAINKIEMAKRVAGNSSADTNQNRKPAQIKKVVQAPKGLKQVSIENWGW